MPTTTSPITEMARERLEVSRFMENPYFRALADGSMEKEQFRATQAQFYYAVRHFTRPMSLLIGRMDDPAQRLAVLHNIVEEHGEFEPAKFHEATFRKFLQSLGSEPSAAPCSAVDAFNLLLSAVCSLDPTPKAICCLGLIEYAFAGVSALIGSTVVERGWVAPDRLVHYSLHAELDLQHAQELFEIVENGPTYDLADVRAGLELGLYAFDRLYRDLYGRE